MINKYLNKKGGIGIIVLVILCLFAAYCLIFVTSERHTLEQKRRLIQDGVTFSNLACWEAVQQGDNSITSYPPDTLMGYLNNPSTIPTNKIHNILNMMNMDYLPIGERYKVVYIEKADARNTFDEYIEKNLGLKKISDTIYRPIDESKSYIKEAELKEFFVHNSISLFDEDRNNPNNYIKNNKYTTIHSRLLFTIKNNVKIFSFKGTVQVPINIDTEFTLERSKT